MAFVDDPTNSAGAGAARLITYNGPEHTGNPFSGNQDIDATLIGSKWISTTLDFSFPTDKNQYQMDYGSTPAGSGVATIPSGFIAFNAAQQTAARYALAQIQAYTNVTFRVITETPTTHATIRFAQSDVAVPTAQAWFPANLNQSGDVWFGTTGEPFYLTPAPGNWGQATMMHELGHAMGLKHGHQNYTNGDLRFYLDPSGANPRWGSQTLPADHDGQSWSLMTYRSDPGATGPIVGQADEFNQPQTYMQDDVAALQFLYGANFNTNNTNTTYTFSPTTGQMSINGVGQTRPTGNIIYRTIWDGGGIDTYDLSNYLTNLNIDLNPGAFSNFGMQVANNRPRVNGPVFAPGNVANALLYNGDVRSLIENVIGGAGNDTFTGNRVNNVIDGSGGTNTFVETGIHTNYSYRQLNTGFIQITDLRSGSPDGVDQVRNIQNVQFADGTFAIRDLLASIISFGSPAFQLNAFGPSAGGWSSDDTYPRELADINHDGNADIVGFATNGVYVSLADGNGGFSAPAFANGTSFWGAQTGNWSSQNLTPRELADINHDSNADIVGFATNGIYVSLADGNGGFQAAAFANGSSFWGAQTGGWSSQDTYTRELADVNLDSNADIVGFATNGVYVSLANGAGGFSAPAFVNGTSFWGAQTGNWSSQDKSPRFMADVDGNGYADIVGFAQAGVYVSLNTQRGASAPTLVAGSSFWGTQTGGWTSQNLTPRELADVNGDGMADIVGFATNGVYVSLAIGNGNFAAPTLGSNTSFWGAQTGGWSSNDLYPRELANITTGDTKADIVGFAQSGVWTSISTSDVAPFTASASSGVTNSSASSGVTNSSPDVALLSQHMAGSFATSSAGDGGTLIANIDDTKTSVVPGTDTTYTIVVSNTGPSDVTGAGVSDPLPAGVTAASWQFDGGTNGGSVFGPTSGSGALAATVNLPVNATISFSFTATIDPSATGSLANTVTVTTVFDPAETIVVTDTDTLTPEVDLSVTKTDGVTTVVPGTPDTYTIVVSNNGPSTAVDAPVTDVFPAALTNVNWTAVASGGSSVAQASGTGNIATTVTLLPGGTATFTAVAQVDPSATGSLTNIASVSPPAEVTDIDPTNNSVTDTDTLTLPPAFALPAFQLSAFGPSAGGWSSDNTYPRELADVSGDGMADIVGFSSAGVVESLATGGGHFAMPTFELAAFGVDAGGWSSNDTYPRKLADVNGDTRADIVAFSSAGVFESLATPGGHFAMPTFELAAFCTNAGGWSSDNTYPRALADVSGDGLADIVGFSSAGVFESLATAGGHFAAPTFELAAFGANAGGWSSNDTYPRALADVNGDGMADIVGFGADGVYESLATGAGHFAMPTFELAAFGTNAGGWTSQNLTPRELADVNGDGMADIVGFATNGVYVSLAIGNGNFAAPTLGSNTSFWGAQTGGWSSNDLYPRELANITTGDTKADIVGFAQSGVWTSISTSDVAPFTASVSSGVTNSSPDVALLSQYMAGSFTTSSQGDGATLITDTPLTTQPAWLTPPHP